MGGRTYGQMDGRMNGRTDVWTERHRDGRIDECNDGHMDGRMHGKIWMDEQKISPFYTTGQRPLSGLLSCSLQDNKI